jgi:two-component system CheB/CheR fusion protein
MSTLENFYVVGIGLSAGGLEPLQEMLASLPDNPGAAFVVIMHLAADKESHLDQMIALRSPLPVSWAEHGSVPEPNHVYVIPSGKILTFQQGKFHLLERRETDRINRAVDAFFTALGESLQNRAIGVILSGTGSDGLEGVKVIEQYGGIVMVQHPSTAQFTGMPTAIISRDHPDIISTPSQLAQALMNFIQVPPYSGYEKHS